MSLSTGTRLGPYEIIAPLGAGGMGEVYRARDTRLDRTVAVKILPAHLSSDATFRQRFEQEAKAISSLNHPHICALYDVGHQDGTEFLVMEYLEGETLAKSLEKGPLPLAQVLKYGAELADALDKAHRQGLVHRDLKPSNIMVTKSGAKLLDFGLAKAAPPLASGATLTAGVTRTTPVTQQGTIVGTFQYMSPEQVEAKELDARSDIFSFGAVLYEMVTGQRAFRGKSQLSVASAILEKDPEPISTLQPLTPPSLDHAIRRCLAKDPEDRWQTARDLLLELKWIAEGGSQADAVAPIDSQRKLRERLALSAVVVLALAAAALAIGFIMRAPNPSEPISLSAEVGADAPLYTEWGASAILSPDGRRMAFIATDSDQKRRIYVRSLDQLQASALSGTENARDHFCSPDGQWLGFFADGKLKKISVQGGAAVTLCDAPTGHGGSWTEGGSIVFAPTIRSPLYKVSSAGGIAEPLTTLSQQAGEITQRWPQVLPGGKAVLFTSNTHGGNYEDADIVAYSISSGQRKTILHKGFYPRYLPSGHLLYMHEGTIFAAIFDLKRLEVTGQPVPIVEGVVTAPGNGGAQFSFSDSGNLVYVPGRRSSQNLGLYWMNGEGKFTPLRGALGDYYNLAFSPDGNRIALEIADGKRTDIWVYEWARDTLTRLTFGGQSNVDPVWTPDGQRIVFTTVENGDQFDLYWKRADGAGEAQRLTQSRSTKYAGSWSLDGKVLAFEQRNPDTFWGILTLNVDGDEKSGWKVGEARPFLNGPFNERAPAFSPDGRWLAYRSDESGTPEVYVQPFPGPARKWQISTGGGCNPKWSRNGKELYYRTPTFTGGQDVKVMVAPYSISGDSFRAEKPRAWSPGQFSIRGSEYSGYALHPDGKRVAVLRAPEAGASQAVNKVTFLFNFFDELRRKVPPGKN
jgi:Tol biopolymer transport system component/predicted Ser/Thr protein kinase